MTSAIFPRSAGHESVTAAGIGNSVAVPTVGLKQRRWREVEEVMIVVVGATDAELRQVIENQAALLPAHDGASALTPAARGRGKRGNGFTIGV
jgi:hypothetical protein